ncbi:hypothetical protein HMPREF9120_02345 [Neisseria sp. oral taxon 020 str. F0370]|nr:hypothetical protein HMPREF9120_02345 [Neisseria sp. oral taxon 020 str. F0370]
MLFSLFDMRFRRLRRRKTNCTQFPKPFRLPDCFQSGSLKSLLRLVPV